ncbi:WD40-repeat-containing domain protein [Mycena vitilis]|nr:WD40-repeat-containing domain protein [Mycena vitilis]
MLAVTTTHQLSLIDPQVLKRPASSLPSCLSLLAPCAASAWSPDNVYLFLSSANTIHQYNPALNTLTDIFSAPVGSPGISHLVSRAKSSLVFATADKIHVLESTKVVQSFDCHKSPITSLALSNDLLASTSAGAAHIHNLSLGSHTVLRGLNLAGQQITTCAFHPHSRARLLLGLGKQLVVYDTTRPSGPVKTIPMNDTNTGDIVSVACSPFSKTLVAVATASGFLGLVDLDKEKGFVSSNVPFTLVLTLRLQHASLFRTLSLKVPLTSITFSPSGESIYLGTENGKLLVFDLRALDKPPKAVVLSESGCRVGTMTVQKKNKGSAETGTKPATGTKVPDSGEGTGRRPSATVTSIGVAPKAKVAPSPSKGRIARIGCGASPARRPSTLSALSPRVTSNVANPKIFSPVQNSRGKSVNIDNISSESPISRETQVESLMIIVGSTSRGTGNKDPSSIATQSAKVLPPSTGVEHTSRLSVTSATRKETTSARSRPVASAARTVSESLSARSARSRSASSVSRPSSSASQSSSVPPVPPLPPSHTARSVLADSRTPSPDLPSVSGDPVTPLPKRKGGVPLGSPDANCLVEAGDGRPNGKGKGKTVVFMEGDEENMPEGDRKERERSLSMQISPRRPSSAGLGASASWAPSPLRNAIPTSPAGGSSSAQNMLRNMLRDTMFELQAEQRSEMVGLHLDLVRMGRSWKKELRDLMDEYVGDLRELRDENKRLREENDCLRRGY